MAGVRSNRSSSLSPVPGFTDPLLRTCGWLSRPVGALHYLAARAGLRSLNACILRAPAGPRRTLEEIWFVTIVRAVSKALIRTPLRSRIIELIDSDLAHSLPPGCVIASCHTPWTWLFLEWCRVHDFAMVVAGANWIERRAPLQAADGGFAPVRRLMRHLQSGGRVLILADGHASSRCRPITFLGTQRTASLFPARLAAAAGVPLLVAIPVLDRGRVRAVQGPRLQVGRDGDEQAVATEQALTFLEEQIRRRPSIKYDILLETAE